MDSTTSLMCSYQNKFLFMSRSSVSRALGSARTDLFGMLNVRAVCKKKYGGVWLLIM